MAKNKFMDTILEAIKEFADQAHGDQTRKYTPERYIVHPVRVMEMCRKYDDRLEVLAAALLHDVVEDTPVTNAAIVDFLQTLMPRSQALAIGKLVVELTDIYTKKAYPHLNRKQRKELEAKRLGQASADAQTIKYADIIDNCLDILLHDPEFGKKFQVEGNALLKLIPNGNPHLYKIALETVKTAPGK